MERFDINDNIRARFVSFYMNREPRIDDGIKEILERDWVWNRATTFTRGEEYHALPQHEPSSLHCEYCGEEYEEYENDLYKGYCSSCHASPPDYAFKTINELINWKV